MDVRLVAATNRDLYFRLNVVSIEIPPLRERKDDIVPHVQKLLMRYNWPGNIRELETMIERAIRLAEGRAIAPDDLRLGEISTADGSRDHKTAVKTAR